MQLILELADELSAALGSQVRDIQRAAFEASALEAYRDQRLTTGQLRRVLGYRTRARVHASLKNHGTFVRYDAEDLQHDHVAGDSMILPQTAW